MCGNEPGTMSPFIESTNVGNIFEFSATFTSTSEDGFDTSSGYSLSIVCKYLCN